MRINSDLVNSINENYIELAGTWLWADKDIYSFDYLEILVQPISLDCITLDFLKFKDDEVTLTIRSGVTSATPLVYLATTQTLPDSNQNSVHNSLQGLQGGLSGNFYHISEPIFSYTSGISASVQTQINTTNFNLQTSSTSLQIQIDTLAQQSVSGMGAGTVNRVGKFITSGTLGDSTISDNGSLVQITNHVSASGNISGNSFVKIGGTSTQFLKANGSIDSNVYITSSSLSPYTLLTTTSAISANLQSQITTNNNSLSAYYKTSGGNITGNISASGNISGNSFVKNGGTSNQFLKADGSVDSNVYTTTASTSAISANLQNQITNNKNSLSAYLPLSGGTLTGQLKGTTISASGNVSGANFVGNLTGYKNVDNGNECTISNGFASNQALFVNYRGATSSINQYNFWNGRAGAGTYAGIAASAFIKVGGTSAQFLKADGSVDSSIYITSSSLTPYTLTTTTSAISANLQSQINLKADKTSLSAYLPLSGGTLTGQLLIKSQLSASGDLIGSRHIIPGGLSTQFLKADGSVDSNSYALDTLGDYYLPLSGGTLAGDLVTQNIRPTSPFYNDLGSVFFPYLSLYVSAINANNINMEGSIIPINSILYDLGSNSNKWRTIYTKDINSVAMSTVFDRAVEAVDILSHALIGFDNQLAPHLNFSNSLGTSATLSGDFYFDGLSLKIRDKNLSLKTLAYTSELSAYTPTSGFNQTISAYLPLSGGTLTGQLKAPSVSASGNISAVNFVGNLTGYKNVEAGNECTLANGYISSGGDLFINYRGATSSINQYKFCNGKGSVYSGILASAFIKNGGTNSQFLMADGSVSLGNNLTNYYLPLSGGTLSGNINFTNPSYGYNVGLRGVIGDNDIWGIRGWSVGSNNGYLEIYTEDDGNEPIYVKQYNTSGSWERTLTLLDAFGNSNFPGQISTSAISATNIQTNSSIIIKNSAGTSDKTKIYDNLLEMRSGTGDLFTSLSANFDTRAMLNVFSTNPSYKAGVKTDQLQTTQGAGFNGSTSYLTSKPIIYTSASSLDKINQLCQIMENYGLIDYI